MNSAFLKQTNNTHNATDNILVYTKVIFKQLNSEHSGNLIATCKHPIISHSRLSCTVIYALLIHIGLPIFYRHAQAFHVSISDIHVSIKTYIKSIEYNN